MENFDKRGTAQAVLDLAQQGGREKAAYFHPVMGVEMRAGGGGCRGIPSRAVARNLKHGARHLASVCRL